MFASTTRYVVRFDAHMGRFMVWYNATPTAEEIERGRVHTTKAAAHRQQKAFNVAL